MRYRLYAGLILLMLAGCSQSFNSPSDFTVSVPADATVTLSNASAEAVCYQDIIATVTDADGKPRNGIVTGVYAQGSFGNFFTNSTFGTIVANPYNATTDFQGKINLNYCSAPFTCSATGDITTTFSFRVQAGTTSASRVTTVTIKKCGT